MRIGRHGPVHVAHDLHVGVGPRNLRPHGGELRALGQRRLDARPRGNGLREHERRQRWDRLIGVEREAGVEHGFGAADLADERARQRLEPGDLDLRAQHVGLRRGAAGVSGVRGGDDVAGEGQLLVDERRRPPPLLEHQERVGRLHADVEDGPPRVGPQPIHVRQRRGATMSADARQRNPLLDRDADVRALQHEGQVIQRRRDHRIVERGDDGGPGFPARVRARAASISSLRSPARRTTSPRLSGSGSGPGACATAWDAHAPRHSTSAVTCDRTPVIMNSTCSPGLLPRLSCPPARYRVASRDIAVLVRY